MYRYIFEINGREYEELNIQADYLPALIEQHINNNELADFYTDQELFIKEQTTGHAIKTNKKLYLIETTQRGWDTYDSGVFCAWSEKECTEMVIARMGGDYADSEIIEIGKASSDLDIGEVVSSFNAG